MTNFSIALLLVLASTHCWFNGAFVAAKTTKAPKEKTTKAPKHHDGQQTTPQNDNGGGGWVPPQTTPQTGGGDNNNGWFTAPPSDTGSTPSQNCAPTVCQTIPQTTPLYPGYPVDDPDKFSWTPIVVPDNPSNVYHFALGPDTLTWNDAVASCQSANASLVIIRSSADQEALQQFLQLPQISGQFQGWPDAPSNPWQIWLGLSDQQQCCQADGTSPAQRASRPWTWVDGTPLASTGYSNWYQNAFDPVSPYRPDCWFNDQHCVQLYLPQWVANYTWDDIECCYHGQYVCSYSTPNDGSFTPSGPNWPFGNPTTPETPFNQGSTINYPVVFQQSPNDLINLAMALFNSYIVGFEPTSAAVDAILDSHNSIRSQLARGQLLQPTQAADMRKMSWNQELADRAVQWAVQCQARQQQEVNSLHLLVPDRVYSNGRIFGQNIYPDPYANQFGTSWSTAAYWWLMNYYQAYNFDNANGPFFRQIIDARTGAVGCGAAWCPNMVNEDGVGMGAGLLTVCNYENDVDVPFEVGQACSACPDGWSCEESSGLCVSNDQQFGTTPSF